MTEALIASQARARFVVTLPPEPTLVGAELLRLSSASFTTLTNTSDAFLHLARRARDRFVIMTPFIDTAGAAWAADIFEATTAPRKLLVMRNSNDLEACGSQGFRLRSAVQRIYDYTFRHERDDGLPEIETFHAKIVLADGVAAYVGSANFLYRSREVNLECGFLLEGDAVSPVYVLVNAILSIFESGNQQL
jgi:phosphatidylserine/phosphatidylglycerophosphate/cardiolipin synthase-like enzyme